MANIEFGSPEWLAALQHELNNSPAYEQAAKNWEGDLYFVVEPEGPLTEPTIMYMDLWHGKCRGVAVVADSRDKTPAYIMSGKYSQWKRVVTGQLDPIQALMTGQLKLKGNMVMIMRHVKAAQEIVRACVRLDTAFSF